MHMWISQACTTEFQWYISLYQSSIDWKWFQLNNDWHQKSFIDWNWFQSNNNWHQSLCNWHQLEYNWNSVNWNSVRQYFWLWCLRTTGQNWHGTLYPQGAMTSRSNRLLGRKRVRAYNQRVIVTFQSSTKCPNFPKLLREFHEFP